VDIGQRRDPTAIVVTEAGPQADGRGIVFVGRHLEALPLGTPYPDVAARIVEVVTGAAERGEVRGVFLDATGVGQPVVDIVEAAARDCWSMRPVYFTHGDRLTGDVNAGPLTVGKAYLVSRLQVLLQDKRLRLPSTWTEAPALIAELLDYEIRVSEDANDRYGAFKVGAHDDLVTALGLAVLMDPSPGPLALLPARLLFRTASDGGLKRRSKHQANSYGGNGFRLRR
jgi:hypothetical protein